MSQLSYVSVTSADFGKRFTFGDESIVPLAPYARLSGQFKLTYKINNGMAKPICVTGSGGVKIAAVVKIMTTTYFLLFLRNLESITPTLANKLNTTGN